MKSFFIGNPEIKLPVIQDGIMGVGISLSGLALAIAMKEEHKCRN